MKHERCLLFYVLLLISLSLIVFPGCSTNEDNAYPGGVEEQIRSLIEPHVRVGAMVGVIHRGTRMVFPFGSKSRDGNDPPNGDTVFEIGSITKTFTGILLAHMHVQGIIHHDDPVGRYLPAKKVNMPNYNGIDITFKHLAAHLSGLPKLPPDMGPLEEYPYLTYYTEDMYDFLNNFTLTSQPGLVYLYSNIGMGLLGHTLGLIDGSNFEELLTREIFTVLGMKCSSVFLTEEQKTNLAIGYDSNLNATLSWDSQDCLQGSGAIKSCLNDLLIYMEANMGLREFPFDAAMTFSHQVVFTIYSDQMVGLGWGIYEMPGQQILWHNGLTAGYTAYLGFNKALSNGVVILFNHCEGPSWEVGEKILIILKEN
jgi:D-alanyl-D-alanine-carboxypeptidase/D-alanyl-D-alanine-endopeptidase